jgi:pantetheine-phosphate adenylyltransferase
VTRIIAGSARGRTLVVPKDGVRPTSDRVRESLFSSLEHRLGSWAGIRVLDLFAGSGAFGLESLSRGAATATLVDNRRASVAACQRNSAASALAACVVLAEASAWLRKPRASSQRFDLVFADPPYGTDSLDVDVIVSALAGAGWLADRAVVVIERSRRVSAPNWPSGFTPEEPRRFGDTVVHTAVWYVPEDESAIAGQQRSSAVRRAVCPGSFDPVTNGHLDIIGRAAALFDEVVVAVLINKRKASLFTVDERIVMLQDATAVHGNVVVDAFHGLLVDFCIEKDIAAIVKGLRAVSDFDYELQMAQMNNRLNGVETLFVSTNPLYSYLSSSLVKEVATYGGDVSGLLPDEVLKRMLTKLAERSAATGA